MMRVEVELWNPTPESAAAVRGTIEQLPTGGTLVEVDGRYYIEAPNTAYEEMTTRVGEVIQSAFRDASIVGNIENAKKAMMRAHDTAVKILKDNGIYSD